MYICLGWGRDKRYGRGPCFQNTDRISVQLAITEGRLHVQMKGALDVQGIQKLLQQQASSSHQHMPRHKAAEQDIISVADPLASDESDAWTS